MVAPIGRAGGNPLANAGSRVGENQAAAKRRAEALHEKAAAAQRKAREQQQAPIQEFALGKAEEHRDEADLNSFLQAGGFPPNVADALDDLDGDRRNVGELLTLTARELNVTPSELVRHLSALPDQLSLFALFAESRCGEETDGGPESLASLIRATGAPKEPLMPHEGPDAAYVRPGEPGTSRPRTWPEACQPHGGERP